MYVKVLYYVFFLPYILTAENQVADVEEFMQKYTSCLQQIRHSSATAMENVCPLCFKTYSTKHSMKRHLLMHKPFRQRFECNLCHKLFNWPGNLRTHKQTVHMFLSTSIRSSKSDSSQSAAVKSENKD